MRIKGLTPANHPSPALIIVTIGLSWCSVGAGAPPYSLSWVRGEGAEACPGRAELIAEVERRLGQSAFDDAAERSLEAQIHRSKEGFRSQIYVRDRDGRTIGKRVLGSADTACGPIFSATALALALLIDPEAAQRAPGANEAVARFELVPSQSPMERDSAPETPPSTAAGSAAPPLAQPASAKARLDSGPTPSAEQAEADLSGRGIIGLAVLPSPAPGIELAVAASVSERWHWSIEALYAPPERTSTDTQADFKIGLTAAGASAGLDILDTRGARLRLDLGVLIGALHVAVYEPQARDPGDFLFAAARFGPIGRITVTPGFFVEIGAAAVAPLVRRGFFVEGESDPTWRQPALGGIFIFGGGAEIP